MALRARPRDAKENPAKVLAVVLIFMYAVSGLQLLLLALLLYKLQLSEQAVRIAVIVIYIVTGLTGGLLAAKRLKTRKFLWGLAAGTLYFALLFCLSFVLKQGSPVDWTGAVTTLILCACGGMAGGMIAG